MTNNTILTVTLMLFLLGMGLSPAFAVPPPEGTLLSSFNAAGTNHGLAFDGTNIYLVTFGSNTIRAYQTDGTPLPGMNIVAGVNISADIAWDPINQVFWAGSNTGGTYNVYTIAKDGTTTLKFNTLAAMQTNGNCGVGCSSILDGIDFDPLTSSIWYSPDGAEINYNFDTSGNLIGTMPINIAPNNMIPECGDDFTSGIMGRANTVYAIHHTCGAFKYDTSTNPPTKINFFSIGHQIEGAACDAVTFRNQGVDAIWIGSFSPTIDAYAIPMGTCSPSVGGEFLAIDSTSLILAGLQSSAIWMIPTLAGLAGAGFYIVKFRINKE